MSSTVIAKNWGDGFGTHPAYRFAMVAMLRRSPFSWLALCTALGGCGGSGVHRDAEPEASSSGSTEGGTASSNATSTSSTNSGSGGAAAGQEATGTVDSTSSTSSSGGASGGQRGVAGTDQAVTATTTTGCTASAGVTTCTGTPAGYGPLAGQPCEEEGNFCEGSYVVGDLSYCGLQPFSVQCCNGVWTSTGRLDDGSVPECTFSETPRPDGSTFDCADGAETCYVGRSACGDNHDAGGNESVACWQLCDDADCSCYCDPDDAGHCSFAPSDAQSPDDLCDCSDDRGAITVLCNYY